MMNAYFDDLTGQLSNKHKCYNCGYEGWDFASPVIGGSVASAIILCPECKYEGDDTTLGYEEKQ